MSIEAIKQALEYLRCNQHHIADNERHAYVMEYNAFIEKLEQAVATEESSATQEPFGFFKYDMRLDAWVQNRNSDKCVAFYTHPQPKCESVRSTWVGLTDDEIEALASWWPSYDQMPALKVLIKDVTNSLKEKNA